MERSFKTHHKSPDSSLLCDLLSLLGVKHTEEYSRTKEKEIPFKTWFGLSRALQDYGVASEAYMIEDKSSIKSLRPPFLIHTSGEEGGNIIVTDLSSEKASYLSMGVEKNTTLSRLIDAWDGNVMFFSASDSAIEPDYKIHRRFHILEKAKKWILFFCFVSLFIFAFITNGLYKNISSFFIAAIDLSGIYVTYLLLQKSLNIHNSRADKFCGVLQKGGCDDILATSASKFFGLFGWSEVGFAYFFVSIAALLIFPQSLPALALCNICCLPFSFWSIWYQKFRAKRWCTLCVTVQASLWLLFFAYLLGGWVKMVFPISPDFFILAIAYIGVMLAINAVMPYLKRDDNNKSDKL